MKGETTSSLPDIIADPEMVAKLPVDQIPRLLGELETVRARLWARLALPNGNGQAMHAAPGDRRLNVQQTAAKLGVTKDYLYRHADRLPFTIRIGRGLGFWEAGVERYLHQRTGRWKPSGL